MAQKTTTERTVEDEAADAQTVEGVARPADVEKRPAGSKPYRSDRSYAEVNANEVVYLDPSSEVGKRLLATGSFTEVDDPQA